MSNNDGKMSFFGPYTICPFDKYHRIIDGRLQKHIFKCSKNYPNQRATCPFNANHRLKPEEYEHHLSVCPTNGNVICYQMSLESEKEIGTVSLQSACSMETNVCYGEDWSGDNNVTYDPLTASETKNVFRPVIGLSKAKKKQYKNYERERIAKIEKHNTNGSIDSKSFIKKESESESPLRVPKNASKAMYFRDESTDDKISFEDLISKLKETKVEDDSNIKPEKYVSTANNTSLRRDSTGNTTNNNITNNDVKIAEKQKVKKEIKETKETNKETNKETKANISLYEYLYNKRIIQVNPKMSATFREAKKISTGRGFNIVYQQIKSEVSQNQGQDTTLEHYNNVFGYDDDKNDNNDIVL
nr:uncharacterized protein LOC116426551 isoform X1 [Nomia melanderi]